jgi:glycosyltransferase involved in cell wall biosynthesis
MINNKVVITNNSSKYIFLFKRNLILSLIENGFSVTVISPHDEYAERIIELGAAYYPIVMDTNGLNPFKDIMLLIDLFKLYKDIKPNTNLTFTIKPNIYGTIVSGFLGIKTINNVTGLGSVFLEKGVVQFIVKCLYKFAFRYSTNVMFQNSEDKAVFIDQKMVSFQKAVLIPGSGVDINRFKPIEVDCSNKLIFLMIGRVLADKGVREYVEAAMLVKNQYAEVEFWLLGGCDSDNSSSISLRMVKDWEEKVIIRYLGEVEDVREFIAQSDVVVLPSYREGMPRVLLEALAMGKPIIGSDVPGCRDIVIDGVNGYFCKVKDALDLSKQMEKMIKHNDMDRKTMGRIGRNQVISKFDERIVLDTYIRLLDGFSHSVS